MHMMQRMNNNKEVIMKKLFVFSLCLISGIACAMNEGLASNASTEQALQYGLQPTQLEQEASDACVDELASLMNYATFEAFSGGQPVPMHVPMQQLFPESALTAYIAGLHIGEKEGNNGVSKRKIRKKGKVRGRLRTFGRKADRPGYPTTPPRRIGTVCYDGCVRSLFQD